MICLTPVQLSYGAGMKSYEIYAAVEHCLQYGLKQGIILKPYTQLCA